jgi:23S rRNA pseudouridine1911/1915/1917 synthase
LTHSSRPGADRPPRAAAGAASPVDAAFQIELAEAGQTIAAVLRERLALPWSAARALCERGKVTVAGKLAVDPARRVTAGERVELRHRAKTPLPARQQRALSAIVYEDSQLVVIDKPAGISSVPYEREETGTAMDLVREAFRAAGRAATTVPLHIVHRIDKDTSGLLLFAKTRQAERSLQLLWRKHDIERRYLCVVHGRMTDRTIESWFVEDRGDGLRGSWRDFGAGDDDARAAGARRPAVRPRGKRAVTHVKVLEYLGGHATLCAVQIETGKTHQIRIHMAESRHPIVGETVYIRDFLRHGNVAIVAPRLMLHAETLGFIHPTTGENILLRRDPPPAFQAVLAELRQRASEPAPPLL